MRLPTGLKRDYGTYFKEIEEGTLFYGAVFR
jgi:hypothetical protein